MIERYEKSALDGVDLVFAALPHGQSQDLAPAILDRGIPLVDLGADFRLRDPAASKQWYGERHRAPELLGSFVYGIPELDRDAIRGARAVAAAGCYPTATTLAIKPLLGAGLIAPATVVLPAVSGAIG